MRHPVEPPAKDYPGYRSVVLPAAKPAAKSATKPAAKPKKLMKGARWVGLDENGVTLWKSESTTYPKL